MNPVVSVIIPAYNTELYIRRAIDSALSQTLTELEVIVVDDCSTDNTVEIVKSYTDERVKLLQNAHNSGAAFARNRALEVARGQWIAILDSDDWYAPDRLAKLVALAKANNADLISDDLYLIADGEKAPWGTLLGESGESISHITKIAPDYFVNSDVEGRAGLRLGFSKPLFDRGFLERHQLRYDSTLAIGEDFWLYMNCFRYEARFFFVPEPYYYYRSRAGSLTHGDKIARLEREYQAVTTFLNHADFLKDRPEVLAALMTRKQATQNYRDYYKFVEPLKQGKVEIAATELARNFPTILPLLARKYLPNFDRFWQIWSSILLKKSRSNIEISRILLERVGSDLGRAVLIFILLL